MVLSTFNISDQYLLRRVCALIESGQLHLGLELGNPRFSQYCILNWKLGFARSIHFTFTQYGPPEGSYEFPYGGTSA
jgi:hypothetical protein